MKPHDRPGLPPRRSQGGFSLIELMVSIAVGMVIIAALALLFANNSRSRQEMEKTSQQIENGRYASQYLRDDLRLAGYVGEMSITSLSVPASVPDPSADTDNATLMGNLRLSVQGYHFGKSAASNSTIPAGLDALLTDRRANTDVLVVRRVSTCYAGPTNAETNCSSMDVTKNKYFQTTLCATHLSNITSSSNLFIISTTSTVFKSGGSPNVTVGGYTPTYFAQRDCSTPAVTRLVYENIYYVANNDVSGDGIPTLKMITLGASAFGSPVAIAEGIETLQIEYGIDDGTNGGTASDGQPDQWKSDPASGIASASAQATAWSQVVAVKLHVLARNTQASAGQFTDTRTYVLGGTATTDNTFGPYNDSYKRHVYTTVARLNNPAGALEAN